MHDFETVEAPERSGSRSEYDYPSTLVLLPAVGTTPDLVVFLFEPRNGRKALFFVDNGNPSTFAESIDITGWSSAALDAVRGHAGALAARRASWWRRLCRRWVGYPALGWYLLSRRLSSR